MGDFVAELDEAIREAKSEIDQINIELRKLPFGADTYKFMMERSLLRYKLQRWIV